LSSTTLEITTQLAVKWYSGKRPPGSAHLPVVSSLTYYAKQLLSGLPPADVHHKLLVVETLNSTQNGRNLLLHFIVGQPGKKKSILIPVVPEKRQDDEKPTHKMRKCLSTTKMLARSFEDEKSSSLMSSSTMIYTMRKLSHYY